MPLEDIAGALLCNFPYLEAEEICKEGGLLEEKDRYYYLPIGNSYS